MIQEVIRTFFIAAMRWCAAVAISLLMLVSHTALAQPLATFGNGETISPAELQDYVSRRVDLRGAIKNYWGAEQIVTEMALTRALVLEGRKRSIERRSGLDENDRFDDIYARAVYSEVAPDCERPADGDATKAWFDAHPEAFVLPPTARISRVILPLDGNIQGKSAIGWLFEQVTALVGGDVKLEDVVQQAEEVYRLDAQGDLGWVELEGDSAVIRALTAAKEGDFLGPLKEGSFAYVFFISQKRDARQLTWDEVGSSASQRALVWCRQHTREQVRDDLFAQYGVQIDKKAIRALFSDEIGRREAH